MGSRDEAAIQSPDFERPPVAEVAVGVEFVPMPALGVVELVRLHRLWEAEFPRIQVQPPLGPSAPVGEMVMAGIGLRIGPAVDPVRVWMLSPSEDTLVQVQHDRLILNWRRLSDGDAYPTYHVLRERFARLWEEFRSAVSELGELRPIIADVTFVNSVPSTGDPDGLSGLVANVTEPQLPGRLVGTRLQYVTEIRTSDNRPGQLVVAAESGSSGQEFQPHGLTLVTRVSLPGERLELDEIMSSLDFAHDTGVSGFTGITTDAMQQEWGRIR